MSYGRGRYSRSPACIYVGNLPDDIREREIEELFSKFGRIRDIDIKRGRNTAGTAYCFIDFENVNEAEYAIERRHNYSFHGNRLRVEFTGDRRPRRKDGSNGPPTRTEHRIIVTNLPTRCSWQHLKDHMRTAGNVGYANIENKKGLVEFIRPEDMYRALDKLDRTELHAYDSSSIIKVRRADSSYNNDYYRKGRRSRSRSSDRYDSRSRSRSRSRRRSKSRSKSPYSCVSHDSDVSHKSHYSEYSRESRKSNEAENMAEKVEKAIPDDHHSHSNSE